MSEKDPPPPPIPSGFTIRSARHPGKIPTDGTYAGIETNWYYQATDPTGSPCAILYCNPGAYTIVDMECLEDISSAGIWSVMNNGYVATHVRRENADTMLMLHVFLMGDDARAGGHVIEHVNRDRLDNRLINLRPITHSIQNYHRPKCRRQHAARPLPEGLTQNDLPKYVIYHKDKVYKPGAEGRFRTYFRVIGHPLQIAKEWTRKDNGRFYGPDYEDVTVFWSSTKSKFKTDREKLADAVAYVALLDKIAADTGFKAEEELYNGKSAELKETPNKSE
jgi:hypothetical protein